MNVQISTNLAYKVIVPEYAKSWVTYKAPSGEMLEPEDLETFNEQFTISPQGEMTRACKIELQALDGSLSTTLTFKQKGSNPQ